MWRDRGIDKRGRCRGPYVGWMWVWPKLRSKYRGSAQPHARSHRPVLRSAQVGTSEDEPRPNPTPSLKVSIEAHPVGPASPALPTA